MASLILEEYSTNFSTVSDKIIVDNFKNEKALFRYHKGTKILTNLEQLNHIINYLVVQKDFLMEKNYNNEIVFLHPKNSTEHTAKYTYYPNSMTMCKEEKIFLSYIN